MRVKVDSDLCQGHSVCLEEAPEVFAVHDVDDGYPKVTVLQGNPPEALRATVERAAKYCPTRVITLLED